jgi:hypothetical protein
MLPNQRYIHVLPGEDPAVPTGDRSAALSSGTVARGPRLQTHIHTPLVACVCLYHTTADPFTLLVSPALTIVTGSMLTSPRCCPGDLCTQHTCVCTPFKMCSTNNPLAYQGYGAPSSLLGGLGKLRLAAALGCPQSRRTRLCIALCNQLRQTPVKHSWQHCRPTRQPLSGHPHHHSLSDDPPASLAACLLQV